MSSTSTMTSCPKTSNHLRHGIVITYGCRAIVLVFSIWAFKTARGSENDAGVSHDAIYAEAFNYKINQDQYLGEKAAHLFFNYIHNQQLSEVDFDRDMRAFSKLLDDNHSLAFDTSYRGTQNEKDLSDDVLTIVKTVAPGVVGTTAGALEAGKSIFKEQWDDYVQDTMSLTEKKLWLLNAGRLEHIGLHLGYDYAGLYSVDSKWRSIVDAQITPLLGFSPKNSAATIQQRTQDYFGTPADRHTRDLISKLIATVTDTSHDANQRQAALIQELRAHQQAAERLRNDVKALDALPNNDAQANAARTLKDEIQKEENLVHTVGTTTTLVAAILKRTHNKEAAEAADLLSKVAPLYNMTASASLQMANIALKKVNHEISPQSASASNSYIAANLALSYFTFGLTFMSSMEQQSAEGEYRKALFAELHALREQIDQLTKDISVNFNELSHRLNELSTQIDAGFQKIEKNEIIEASQITALSDTLNEVRSQISNEGETHERHLRELLDESRIDLVDAVLQKVRTGDDAVKEALFNLKQLGAVHSKNGGRTETTDPSLLRTDEKVRELSKSPFELTGFLVKSSRGVSAGPPIDTTDLLNPLWWNSGSKAFLSIVSEENNWTKRPQLKQQTLSFLQELRQAIDTYNTRMSQYFGEEYSHKLLTDIAHRYKDLYVSLSSKYVEAKEAYSKGMTTGGTSLNGIDLSETPEQMLDWERSPNQKQSFRALVSQKRMKQLWSNVQIPGLCSPRGEPHYRPPDPDQMQKIPDQFLSDLDPLYKVAHRLGLIDINIKYMYVVWETNSPDSDGRPFRIIDATGKESNVDLCKANRSNYLLYHYRIMILATALYQGTELVFHIGYEDPRMFAFTSDLSRDHVTTIYYPILDQNPTAWDDDYSYIGKFLRGLPYSENVSTNFGMNVLYEFLQRAPNMSYDKGRLGYAMYIRACRNRSKTPLSFTPWSQGFEFFRNYFMKSPEPNSAQWTEAENLKTRVLRSPQFRSLEPLFNSSRDKVSAFRELLKAQIQQSINQHQNAFASYLRTELRQSKEWTAILDELNYLKALNTRISELCFSQSLSEDTDFRDMIYSSRQLPSTSAIAEWLVATTMGTNAQTATSMTPATPPQSSTYITPAFSPQTLTTVAAATPSQSATSVTPATAARSGTTMTPEDLINDYSETIGKLSLKYEVPTWIKRTSRDLELTEYMLTNMTSNRPSASHQKAGRKTSGRPSSKPDKWRKGRDAEFTRES